MKKTFTQFSLEKIDSRLFFLLLFLYQVLLIIQGFDMGDEGLFGTFYQQIFKDPQTVQFSFMFWFSGIVGGTWVNLFPWMGLFGIRLAGALVITATIMLTYKLLKKYINNTHLKLGLFMILISLNNNPKGLSYNNISAFLYIVIAWFLFTGLKEKKPMLLFLSGLTVSLNMFTRLPNVLGTMLVVIIVYNGIVQRSSFKYILKQAVYFAGGFIVTSIAVLGIMKMIGHLDYFVNSVKLVSAMGHGSTTESNYGILKLVKRNLEGYKKAVYFIMLIGIFLTAVVFLMNFIREKLRAAWLSKFFKFAIFVLLILLIAKGKFSNVDLLDVLFGVALFSALMIFIIGRNDDLKLLTLIGCFVLVVLPFGSSEGIDTVGIYSLWIVFPIALDFIFNVRTISINNHLTFKKQLQPSFSLFFISERQLGQVKKYALAVFIFTCLTFAFYYPYFDRHNRFSMHYSIHNKYTRGIYTTEGRSEAMNSLLEASARYVKPDDYLLAYDCAPMLNYMTDTKPYIRNPWPWLYESPVFKYELYRSVAETKKLPVVIVQKIKTLGSGNAWPEQLAQDSLDWEKLNHNRNMVLGNFLTEFHYTEVWQNNVFSILIPNSAVLTKH